MIVALYPAGGGLGNLLFQHNTIFALAKKYNSQIYIITDYHESARLHIKEYSKLFNHVQFITNDYLNNLSSDKRIYVYEEPSFIFNEINFEINDSHLYVIKGYFQSYKYFNDYLPDIKNILLENENELYTKMKEKYLLISCNKNTICVHIRRGDYLNYHEYYSILDEKYYENGLALFNESQYKILIFAENVNEISNWNVWKKYDTHFVNDLPEALPTLFLMSLCNHFIVANSSLSVNAYYLSNKPNSQKIIAPSKWFGNQGPYYNIYDIVPNNAIIL